MNVNATLRDRERYSCRCRHAPNLTCTFISSSRIWSSLSLMSMVSFLHSASSSETRLLSVSVHSPLHRGGRARASGREGTEEGEQSNRCQEQGITQPQIRPWPYLFIHLLWNVQINTVNKNTCSLVQDRNQQAVQTDNSSLIASADSEHDVTKGPLHAETCRRLPARACACVPGCHRPGCRGLLQLLALLVVGELLLGGGACLLLCLQPLLQLAHGLPVLLLGLDGTVEPGQQPCATQHNVMLTSSQQGDTTLNQRRCCVCVCFLVSAMRQDGLCEFGANSCF